MPGPTSPARRRYRMRWWEIVLGAIAAALIGETIRSLLR
jgi:hypothetical protein